MLRRNLAAAALLATLVLALVSAPALAADESGDPFVGVCERVVDGDTIVVEGLGKVRLIGVDTPETVHPNRPVEFFGKEASAFTKTLVEGKRVRLEWDFQKTDKYRRYLAYVYLVEGDVFVNEEIVRQGFGFAYTKYPFRYMERFRALEREAREAGRGLWAEGGAS